MMNIRVLCADSTAPSLHLAGPPPRMSSQKSLTSPSSLVSSWAQLRKSSYLAKGTTGSGSSRRYSFNREATVCTSVVLPARGHMRSMGARELQEVSACPHPPAGSAFMPLHMCVHAHKKEPQRLGTASAPTASVMRMPRLLPGAWHRGPELGRAWSSSSDDPQPRTLLRSLVPQVWVDPQGWQCETLHCCKSYRAGRVQLLPTQWLLWVGGITHDPAGSEEPWGSWSGNQWE